MKKSYVILWYISIVSFIITIISFFDFMFHLSVENMVSVLLWCVLSFALYNISSRKISSPKGYTAIQAISFYKECKKEGLGKVEQCKKKFVKFNEIAQRFEYSKNLGLDDLYELYEIGYGMFK